MSSRFSHCHPLWHTDRRSSPGVAAVAATSRRNVVNSGESIAFRANGIPESEKDRRWRVPETVNALREIRCRESGSHHGNATWFTSVTAVTDGTPCDCYAA